MIPTQPMSMHNSPLGKKIDRDEMTAMSTTQESSRPTDLMTSFEKDLLAVKEQEDALANASALTELLAAQKLNLQQTKFH